MPALSTRQKDALVWFRRLSLELVDAYRLADCLAGGPLQARHPGGAISLIRKLKEAGYIENVKPNTYRITPSGREEADRIRAARLKAKRPLISGVNAPAWATIHLR